jgi:hypothetical protein
MNEGTALNLQFDPLLPDSWLIAVALLAALLVLAAGMKRQRGFVLRGLCVAAFILALLNPSLLREERQSATDVAVIVTDQSPSQTFGKREKRTQEALRYLQDTLESRENLDVRFIHAPQDAALANETRLFDQIDQAFSDVPLPRRAGIIIVSDGQIHDVPAPQSAESEYGPVHILLSGEKNEKDRQLVIRQAPSYGIVGEQVRLIYEVVDTDNIGADSALITVRKNNRDSDVFMVPVGKKMTLDLPIEHAGQNVFALDVEAVDGEITQANNRVALIVNGVRDRLRVLLVSGQPHAGGRTWRDLMTSDPGVDLVHFTILREPNKLDSTPQNELSLIAFPFQELFEVKLHEFDLIIFDRYKLNHILPNFYFENIVDFVRQGGALLEASGPEFATDDSVYTTALGDILPAQPDGDVLLAPFKPELSDKGKQHPVTRDLNVLRDDSGNPLWGQWLRQISVAQKRGDILMTGLEQKPLLILDRMDEGRVAQITSDQIWLWSRGYQQGGPHTELLRRVVHWLMKEPELDERALNISVSDSQITVRRQKYGDTDPAIRLTRPDQSQEILTLAESQSGTLELTIQADQLGIYEFEDSTKQKRFAVIGAYNPPELRAVQTTPDIIKPLSESSGGGVFWLADTPRPDIGQYVDRRRYSGSNWLGLRKNNEYTVTGLESHPFMPSWAIALGLLLLAGITWWYEGRDRT